MPEINGVQIPEAGVTTQLIADPIGGHVYEVTTVVTVDQTRLDNVEKKLQEAQADEQKAKERVAAAQAVVDAIKEVLPK